MRKRLQSRALADLGGVSGARFRLARVGSTPTCAHNSDPVDIDFQNLSGRFHVNRSNNLHEVRACWSVTASESAIEPSAPPSRAERPAVAPWPMPAVPGPGVAVACRWSSDSSRKRTASARASRCRSSRPRSDRRETIANRRLLISKTYIDRARSRSLDASLADSGGGK